MSNTNNNGEVVITWYSTENSVLDGEILKLAFQLEDGDVLEKNSIISVMAQEDDICDQNLNNVAVTLEDGEIKKHRWEEGTITVEPSCQKEGTIQFACKDCGKRMTEQVPIVPHKYKVEKKNPSCNESGVTTYTCEFCGHSYSEEVPALVHDWDKGRAIKAATENEEGKRIYTCNRCGATKSEKIEKLQHPVDENVPAGKSTNTITVSNFIKGYSAKAQSFKLDAKVNGKAKLSYKSNNKKVKVDKNGKVTIAAKFSGTAIITITAAATNEYNGATKTITVSVPTVTNVTKAAAGKGQMTVQWKKNTTGKGYEIQVSLKKNFKKVAKKVKIKKNSTVKTTIKKLKKGTYYVRIRTINGKAYSNWSKAKTVKITK